MLKNKLNKIFSEKKSINFNINNKYFVICIIYEWKIICRFLHFSLQQYEIDTGAWQLSEIHDESGI
jgi:hypothetical protein